MTTLVTGGTGFLGRHLVDRLLERGDQVRVLTRSFNRDLTDRGVDIVEGNLSNPDDIGRAVDGVDRVYHLAGKVERDRSRAHLMYQLHVEGTRRLMASLVDRDIEKIVYASTSGTVGVSKHPDRVATDDSPSVEHLVRRWPYYLSKIYAERVCRRFIDRHDLPIVMMRPTLLLGPGDHTESSTGDVVSFLQRDIPAAMAGGISVVDVRDVADAFIAAMDAAPAGRSYLLGAENLEMTQFFGRLADITGIPAPKLAVPARAALLGTRLMDHTMRALGRQSPVDPVSVEMAQHFWYIDSSRARAELDWQPRPVNQTLRQTVRWVRQHHPQFVSTERRRHPPEQFVPRETVEFANKMAQTSNDD